MGQTANELALTKLDKEKMIDKCILFALGALLLSGNSGFLVPVITALLAFCYLALSLYFSDTKAIYGLMGCFAVICFFNPDLTLFLPALCYDCIRCSFRRGFGLVVLGGIPFVWLLQHKGLKPWQLMFWLFFIVIAILLSVRTKEEQQMKTDLLKLRDDSTELKLVMQKRQKELLEKQDYEIHLATLQERNRIAREIHDNVGHMLSRSILQMGALLTIYKENPIHEQLGTVNETLNEAMNNIRESIHDLHNESLDLKQAILKATQELGNQYQITLDYDMTEQIPRNVKYCFIAIIKEAMVNVVKHSNADRIMLLCREHPGFWQMSIEDNGTVMQNRDVMEVNTGIGLSNMEDRVKALGGTIHISADRGFRILVSVPKNRG